MIKNYITSRIISLIKKDKFLFIMTTIYLTFLTTIIMYGAEISLYRAAREVFIDRAYDGLYLADYDLYVCIDKFSCEHERGHAYDASGASRTWIYKEWRSSDTEFRINIDTINACTTEIFDNYDILHTEYPKTSRILMAVNFQWTNPYDEELEYRQTYADLYAIMKTYRWDIYHYDDVEDMVAEGAITCWDFLDRRADTLRPRQN